MISDTELRDVRTYFSHYPRNLVTKHRRHWNDIVSSEQQVGVTQPRGLHVDEDFASDRRGDVDVLEIEPATECVNYKCLHLGLLAVALEPTWCSKQPGEEPLAAALPASRLSVSPGIGLSLVSSFRVSPPLNLTKVI